MNIDLVSQLIESFASIYKNYLGSSEEYDQINSEFFRLASITLQHVRADRSASLQGRNAKEPALDPEAIVDAFREQCLDYARPGRKIGDLSDSVRQFQEDFRRFVQQKAGVAKDATAGVPDVIRPPVGTPSEDVFFNQFIDVELIDELCNTVRETISG